jgi:LacI family transcriptional regulator
MHGPRVLIVLDTLSAWSRGILRGFARVAHERGYHLLHYHPDADLDWIAGAWPMNAAVLGPATRGAWPRGLRQCVTVSVNADRSAEGIASVCLDEERVADLALAHFTARGFRNVATFRFDDSPFAVGRERRFHEGASRAGLSVGPNWWVEGAEPPRSAENPDAIAVWLASLQKPCGIFACCDAWARVVARYACESNLRVPEDIALVGADNDAIECEVVAPPLSSVAIPWKHLGEAAADFVQRGLRGESIGGERVRIAPLDVVTRRSSDTFAVGDPLVSAAVAWIHEHAERHISVPMVAKAVGATRQRLERHFRLALGRTVMHEARRVHVERARRLLSTTDLPLGEIAKQSGFTNAALLSVAFGREVGMPPGTFRRQRRGLDDADD